MVKAKITVYLQALDGHFLGPNAYETDSISIKFRYSRGEVDLRYKLSTGVNDGTPTTDFISGVSSYMPIVTVGPQTSDVVPNSQTNFLLRDDKTIAGSEIIHLSDEIEMAELEVSIPTTLKLGEKNERFHIKQQVILYPAQTIYTVIIVVPGLYLDVPTITPGIVSVYVRMMCGCAVSPTTLWPPTDFIVFADVMDIEGKISPYMLEYDKTQPTNSLFSYTLPDSQGPIRSVTYRATQISTVNYGVVVQKYS